MITDVPRKKTMRDITELPESFKALKGYDSLKVQELDDLVQAGPSEEPTFKSGVWRIHLTGANDPSEAAQFMDPLLMLGLIANASFELEERLANLARFCRTEGKTWTQIGEALGMSKQAAWERFSGEE